MKEITDLFATRKSSPALIAMRQYQQSTSTDLQRIYLHK